MPLSLVTHRLAAAAVIAGGAVGLLAGAGSSAAASPGVNGTIVVTKCEDGATCKTGHIWTVDPATGVEHPLTSDPARFDDDPAVSPDGTRVAYQRCLDSSQNSCTIAVIPIGGGAPVDLTSGSDDDYPAFSPDGSKIVFSRQDTPSTKHLYVMQANGSNVQPLTSGAVGDRSPAWSPDGSTIAFERYVSGTGTRIYKMSAGGGTPLQLTSGPTDYGPGFSTDGTHIAWGTGSKIQVMDANGANQHTLSDAGPNYIQNEPVYSPDGTQIAYERYSNTPPNPTPLMVMNADGSNPHPISPLTEEFYAPDWQSTHPAPPSAPAPVRVALTLTAPKKESVRKGRLYVFATSNVAASGAANGRVSLPSLAKSYRLRPVSRALAANARTKIWLKIPAKTLRATRSALARHHGVKATLVVRVNNGAGNTASRQLRVRLTK